jgi:DNA-binding FadR family transcriptional regulator
VPLETIEHKRLYRQVADQLRALIDQGEFAPGDKLPPERELAETLGISRPTLREALIALEVEGRIRIRVGSGVYVADSVVPAPGPTPPVQADGPFEVLYARQIVEAGIAHEAALKAKPNDIAALRAILAAMASARSPSDDAVRTDREFHVTLAGILGNALLARLVGELYDQRITPYFSQLASYFENPESWAQALAEHQAVYNCIAEKDAEGARAAMRHHLECSQERFSQSFGEIASPRHPLGQGKAPRRHNGRRRASAPN